MVVDYNFSPIFLLDDDFCGLVVMVLVELVVVLLFAIVIGLIDKMPIFTYLQHHGS